MSDDGHGEAGLRRSRAYRSVPPSDTAAVRRAEQDKEAAQIAWTFGSPRRACGIGAVETFAAGLEQDGVAVRAASTEPWSSGQAEGQVNRLKMLKRQSYGRASFDLLRRRVLMAA